MTFCPKERERQGCPHCDTSLGEEAVITFLTQIQPSTYHCCSIVENMFCGHFKPAESQARPEHSESGWGDLVCRVRPVTHIDNVTVSERLKRVIVPTSANGNAFLQKYNNVIFYNLCYTLRFIVLEVQHSFCISVYITSFILWLSYCKC